MRVNNAENLSGDKPISFFQDPGLTHSWEAVQGSLTRFDSSLQETRLRTGVTNDTCMAVDFINQTKNKKQNQSTCDNLCGVAVFGCFFFGAMCFAGKKAQQLQEINLEMSKNKCKH